MVRMVRRSSEDLLKNIQKILLRSQEDLREIFIVDFLKISKKNS